MSTSKVTSKEKRFGFGDNWESYSKKITEDRIKIAENSLKEMLGIQNFQGMRFLDIGSGNGLFSLAARRLGAIVESL